MDRPYEHFNDSEKAERIEIDRYVKYSKMFPELVAQTLANLLMNDPKVLAIIMIFKTNCIVQDEINKLSDK